MSLIIESELGMGKMIPRKDVLKVYEEFKGMMELNKKLGSVHFDSIEFQNTYRLLKDLVYPKR